MSNNSTTKDKVLALLEKNKGKPVSGEEMATEIGVSRTSIWKAITKIRDRKSVG